MKTARFPLDRSDQPDRPGSVTARSPSTAQDDLTEATVDTHPAGDGRPRRQPHCRADRRRNGRADPRDRRAAAGRRLRPSDRRTLPRPRAVDVTVTVPSGTAVKSEHIHAPTSPSTADAAAPTSPAARRRSSWMRSTATCGCATAAPRPRAGRVTGSVVVRSGRRATRRSARSAASLSAGFGSGELEVAAVRGTVRARAGSGDAPLGAVYGDVDLASGSGGVAIGLPAGVTGAAGRARPAQGGCARTCRSRTCPSVQG